MLFSSHPGTYAPFPRYEVGFIHPVDQHDYMKAKAAEKRTEREPGSQPVKENSRDDTSGHVASYRQEKDGSAQVERGSIVKLLKGFGFLQRKNSGDKNVFFAYSQVQDYEPDDLQVGDVVEYVFNEDSSGRSNASDVRFVEHGDAPSGEDFYQSKYAFVPCNVQFEETCSICLGRSACFTLFGHWCRVDHTMNQALSRTLICCTTAHYNMHKCSNKDNFQFETLEEGM